MNTKRSANDIRMLRHLTKKKGLYFSRYFFKNREGRKFMVSEHHRIIDETLERVYSGEIKRLVINIPPGYTKTEEAVVKFISRGFAINPQSLFMHLSYADPLALHNSSLIKDTIDSDEYQELFPMKLRNDSKSKKKWYTEAGGGLYATAAGGPVTGFRAGRMEKNKFSGAMVIDDPIKVQDAFSDPIRMKINERFTGTFKSRLALESDTPIILIMQRIHDDDPSAFLLKGGTGEKWHHLLLPANIPKEPIKDWYPQEFTHGIPIEYDLPPGPLWEFKHTHEELERIRTSDSFTYDAQYQQQPAMKGGSVFKEEFWNYYKVLPQDIMFKRIYCDTAQKTNTWNDYTVFECWGYSPTYGIFLIDLYRGKLESPELMKKFKAFFNKNNTHKTGQCTGVQKVIIEDASSGAGLIQSLKKETHIPVMGIPRTRDKVSRSFDGVPYIESGNVYLPEDAPYLFEFLQETGKFTPLMTHANDDQIDPMLDAIEDMLIKGNLVFIPSSWEN